MFYSAGSLAAEFSPVTKIAFYGLIFDGDQYLGAVHRNHFMKMSLPPGVHIFSGGFDKHAAKNSQLQLNLEPGNRYFVKAMESDVLIPPFLFRKGSPEGKICNEAQAEAKDSNPTKEKWIAKDKKASQVQPPELPACGVSN